MESRKRAGYSLREVAELMGLEIHQVRYMVRKGAIPVVHVSERLRLVPASWVEGIYSGEEGVSDE